MQVNVKKRSTHAWGQTVMVRFFTTLETNDWGDEVVHLNEVTVQAEGEVSDQYCSWIDTCAWKSSEGAAHFWELETLLSANIYISDGEITVITSTPEKRSHMWHGAETKWNDKT